MLEIAIVIYGVTASSLSVYLGSIFYRLNTVLAKPVAIMAWGGAAAGYATLIFSLSSLVDIYKLLSPEAMALLRAIIFTGITGADVYMLHMIKKIRHG